MPMSKCALRITMPPNGPALSCRPPVNVPGSNGRLPASRPAVTDPAPPAAGRLGSRARQPAAAGQLQCLVSQHARPPGARAVAGANPTPHGLEAPRPPPAAPGKRSAWRNLLSATTFADPYGASCTCARRRRPRQGERRRKGSARCWGALYRERKAGRIPCTPSPNERRSRRSPESRAR